MVHVGRDIDRHYIELVLFSIVIIDWLGTQN